MSTLKKILDLKINEYKNKSYDELSMLVDEDTRFIEEYEGKSYNFVVRVKKNHENLKILIECSRDIFLLNMFFKFKCFSIDKSGIVKDAEPF